MQSRTAAAPVTSWVPPSFIAEESQATASYSEGWRLSRPCSGVTKPSGTTNRLLDWEDEAPAEPRFRRVRQDVSPKGRMLPGMPLELAQPEDLDPDEKEAAPFRGFRAAGRPWWRPATAVGRVLLGLGVLAVAGGLAAAVILSKNYLQHDAGFRISGAANIQAAGLPEVSRAEMLPVFGEDIGRNIFFVPLAERRKQLEQIPWVQQATVMRLLPDQIRVSIVERVPVAFAHQGGLVDADGVLLDMPAAMMAQRNYSFPVVTGINPNDPPAARKARMAVYQRLVSELDANGQHGSSQISEVDLTNPEDAVVTMPEQGGDVLAHFGQDQFEVRYQRYKTHIAEWRQQYPKLSSVDLRYDDQVILDMAEASDPAPVAAKPDAAKPDAGKPDQAAAASTASANVQAAPAKPLAVKASAKTPVKAPVRTQVRKARKTVRAKKGAPVEKTAAKNRKKRAEVKRAALNNKPQKTTAATPPAAAAQGQ